MSQSLVKNLVHIVFSTKNRMPFLDDKDIRGEMHAYLHKACETYQCPSLRVGGTEDHVHILCHLSKNISGALLIQELKKCTSKWIKTKGGRFTGFYWQKGYAYFSVSTDKILRVIKYIDSQEDHHRVYSFQDEFRRLLSQSGLEFDERYIWQ